MERASVTGGTAELPSPEVSVVIPCKDDSHLGATLESLVAQRSAPPFEVVVVDSSGHELARGLESWHERLRLSVVKAGAKATAGANRNTGVAVSRGTTLLFVDADDTVQDGYIRAMARALQAHDLACSRIDLKPLNPTVPAPSHPQNTGLITAEMKFLPFAGAGTLGIRRSLFEAIGGLDPSLPCYEEADLCWRLQLAGNEPPVFVADAVLNHRLEPVLMKRWRKAVTFGRAEALLYRRYRNAGMPRESIATAVTTWFRLLRRLLRLLTGSHERGLAWEMGLRTGRLRGSFRYRVPYF